MDRDNVLNAIKSVTDEYEKDETIELFLKDIKYIEKKSEELKATIKKTKQFIEYLRTEADFLRAQMDISWLCNTLALPDPIEAKQEKQKQEIKEEPNSEEITALGTFRPAKSPSESPPPKRRRIKEEKEEASIQEAHTPGPS